ncbi:MAG: hypothetical protein OXM61_16605 [Candidatus Poribacteria bacterium]|nr:hypothetical protein [Candidatus Poribacteria bacterium]
MKNIKEDITVTEEKTGVETTPVDKYKVAFPFFEKSPTTLKIMCYYVDGLIRDDRPSLSLKEIIRMPDRLAEALA